MDTWNEIKINSEDVKLLEKNLPKNLSSSNRQVLLQYLYKILCWEKFEKQLVGNESIKIIKPVLRLPLEIILFMIMHIDNIELILKHLLKN